MAALLSPGRGYADERGAHVGAMVCRCDGVSHWRKHHGHGAVTMGSGLCKCLLTLVGKEGKGGQNPGLAPTQRDASEL